MKRLWCRPRGLPSSCCVALTEFVQGGWPPLMTRRGENCGSKTVLRPAITTQSCRQLSGVAIFLSRELFAIEILNLSGLPLPHGVVLTSASRAEMQGVLALVLLVCTTTLEPSDAFLASHGPLPSSPRQRTHPAREGKGKSRAEQLRAFNEQSLRSLRRDRRKQNPQGVLALAAQIPVDDASHMLLAQVTSAAAAVHLTVPAFLGVCPI